MFGADATPFLRGVTFCLFWLFFIFFLAHDPEMIDVRLQKT